MTSLIHHTIAHCGISGLLAAFITLMASPCFAQDAKTLLPETVLRYVDAKTAVVGWIDIEKLDLDGFNAFKEKLSGSAAAEDQSAQLKGTRDALVQLGVRKIYWVSDLAGLTNGPQAVIVPVSVDKQDVVAVILKALISDTANAVVGENGAILAGDSTVIAALRQPKSGPASADLLTAVNRIKDPHGLVLLTPVSAMLPVVGILPQLVDGDVEKVSQAAEWLVNLRSVSLSGELPPSKGTLRIATKTDEVATGLTTFVNEWTKEKLANSAETVKLAADGDDIVLNITSTDHATAVLSAVQQFSTGNHRPNAFNSLKQIALAMHNFHDVFGHFPPQALADANGNRLLSWRVMILPYLDQAPLYTEFHLDEPWDSVHNLQLVSKMPAVLKSLGQPSEKSEPGKTRFVAPLTKDSPFGRAGAVRIQDITDGTSNTLMVVEASADKAMIWTKPEDILIDENNPLNSIIAKDTNGFAACLCDGAARFFSRDLNQGVLQALLSVSGGEVVDWDKAE